MKLETAKRIIKIGNYLTIVTLILWGTLFIVNPRVPETFDKILLGMLVLGRINRAIHENNYVDEFTEESK